MLNLNWCIIINIIRYAAHLKVYDYVENLGFYIDIQLSPHGFYRMLIGTTNTQTLTLPFGGRDVKTSQAFYHFLLSTIIIFLYQLQAPIIYPLMGVWGRSNIT